MKENANMRRTTVVGGADNGGGGGGGWNQVGDRGKSFATKGSERETARSGESSSGSGNFYGERNDDGDDDDDDGERKGARC